VVALPTLPGAGAHGWFTAAAMVASLGALNLITVTLFGMAAGAGAALAKHSPIWLVFGCVWGLIAGVWVEQRRPKM
jgi:hypothetical protein